jgi:uncharacterized protein (TIGR04255 family)
MTGQSEFKLDLEESFPALPNAPIVEAVIQLDANPIATVELSAVKKLLAKRFGGYVISDLVHLETGFTGSATGMDFHQKSRLDGFRLTSPDGKYVCQWKRAGLVFSRLAPYEDWEKLRSAFDPFWATYLELFAPPLVELIGVRFISQISLKEHEKLSDYVENPPPPLGGIGLKPDSFFHQDIIPVVGYPYEIRLIRAMQRDESPRVKSVLIVDINIVKTEGTIFGDLEECFREIRFLKNKVFFTYMKDAKIKFG